jgi:hypothetical protein
MDALAWIVAPAIAGEHRNLIPVLVVCFTAGLIWQFVLVLLLNGFSLREPWLQRPSTSDGRRSGRLRLCCCRSYSASAPCSSYHSTCQPSAATTFLAIPTYVGGPTAYARTPSKLDPALRRW